MPSARSARPFEVRHLQIARAVAAAIAAVMITFSPDHSAALGMAVFSGFAILTAFLMIAGAWVVCPAGRRGRVVLLGAVSLVAGMIAGIATLRTDAAFFAVVAAWAVLSGIVEGIAGLRDRRADAASTRSEARDAVFLGALSLVLAAALLCVPAGYALTYTIEEAHRTFTLTGITIGVGIFGAYAAIVAVYLAIAGFSPRKDPAPAVSDEHSGGAA